MRLTERLSFGEACGILLAVAGGLVPLYLADRHLPLYQFCAEHPFLGRALVWGTVAVGGGLVYLLFYVVFLRRPGRCPSCGEKIGQGYVDFARKTIRCETCGRDAPIDMVLGREGAAQLAEAVLQNPNASQRDKEKAKQFRDEVLGPTVRLSGIDLSRSRNARQGICILACGIGGAAIGGLVGGWDGMLGGAFAALAFGLILSGLALLVYPKGSQ